MNEPLMTVNGLAPTHKLAIKLQQLSVLFAIGIAFVLPLSTALTDIFCVTAAVLNLLSGNLRSQYKAVSLQPVAVLFLAFFALFVIGMTYSSVDLNTALLMLKKYSDLLFMPLLLPLFFDKRNREYALYAFLAGMVITLVLGYLKKYGLVIIGTKYSDSAVFKSHIQTNFLVAFMVYLLIYQFVIHKRHRWWLAIVLGFAAYEALFISQGRSGYVIFVLLVTLSGWQFGRWKGAMIAMLINVLLLGAAFSFSSSFKHRTEAVAQSAHVYVTHKGQAVAVKQSTGQRLSFIINSLKVIKKNPIFGTGTGSFAHEYAKLPNQHVAAVDNPCNEYLNIWVQIGIFGVSLFLILLFTQWRLALKLAVADQYLARGVTVAIGLGCLINSWLMDTTEGHFFAFFSAVAFGGMLLSHVNGKRSQPDVQEKFSNETSSD